MKRIIVCISLLFTVISCVFAEELNFGIKEQQFEKIDDVVNEFVLGIKNANIQKIYSVSAVNEMAESYSFDKISRRLDAINPIMWKAPNIDDVYISINKIDFMSLIARQTKVLIYSLLLGNQADGTTISPYSEDESKEILEKLNVKRLNSLEYIRSDFPVKSLENNERYIKNSKAAALPLGADTSTERLVLVKFEDKYYFFGLHFLRYNGFWRIDALNSPLAGTEISGRVVYTSEDDYMKTINN